ncbi:caspase family protein [Rhizobium leguminosarum]|nr:caspase family protein [Rhizobium leguminosarum]
MTSAHDAPIIDDRSRLAGKPGLHAFVVGVSDYPNLPALTPQNRSDRAAPHFGLRKLASPALSAYRIARALTLWKPTLTVPLATVRLLLAPSAEEKLTTHSLAAAAPRPTWQNFATAAANWRKDVSTHPDNVALFYFGGHGIQRYLHDQILLLEGFGDGIGAYLSHGVDTQRLIRGMATAPEYPNMGRRQLFLFDACRFSPPEVVKRDIENVGDIWQLPNSLLDDRSCTVLYATAPGKLSYANRGQSTVFAKAFIRAMNREGAQEDKGLITQKAPGWSIRATSLAPSIEALVKLDPTPLRNEQRVLAAGASSDFVLRTLPRAPRFRISMRLQPSADYKRAKLSLQNDHLELVRESGAPIAPYPYQSRLEAGIYLAQIKLDAAAQKSATSISRAITVGPGSTNFVFDTSK